MEPEGGFAAQVAAGATIYVATHLGFPLSTTHVVSGAVMGAGATQRLSAVRWGVAGQHRHRLDADDPGGGARRRARLLAGAGDLLNRPRSRGQLPGPGRNLGARLALDLLERLLGGARREPQAGTGTNRSAGPYFFTPPVMPQKTNFRSAAALPSSAGG